MSTQFHTPSLGDEVFDLTDVEPNGSVEFSNSSKPQVSLKLGVPEPVKPVSAYALFFRDTVSAIKAQNPNTSFEDISKTVNSMWQVLDPAYKNVYNKKSDLAKKEYIQKMATYRNSQLRQIDQDEPSLNSYNHVDVIQHANISPKSVQLTSRPTVFTVSKSPSGSSVISMKDQLSNNIVYSNNANSQLVDNTIINQELQNVQRKGDAGSVQTCLRENCNKYAIINPDWEDEYCSNECVVLHCRNVFNQWVRSNMEGQV